MKQGKSLQALGEELQRQRRLRKDFLADTSSLEMEAGTTGADMRILLDDKVQTFAISPIAHQQIASRLQIPFRYYQKMQTEYPSLLEENVNGWFSQNPEKRMLRVLDGKVRAFLSDRYRRLDNLELCAAVLPIIQEMKGAEIASCEVTEAHLYLKVINKRLKAEVGVGDIVQAGFCLSNSEVGMGSLKVEPLVYRLACKNGMIIKDFAQKRFHIGKQVEGDGDEAYELYSDETLQADDKAFFLKVQDTVRCAVDEAKFQLTVDKLREARKIPIEHDPVRAVEELADKFMLTQAERGDVLRQLFMAGDSSRYGLIQAVTAASQICSDYERATDLERIGGEILSAQVPRALLTDLSHKAGMKNVTPFRQELAMAE